MKALLTSQIFRDIANILQIKGDNPFRIRAYERAAQNIESLTDEDIDRLIAEDSLTRIPGVGVDLSGKIKEIFATGGLKYYEQLKRSVPEGLLELLNIPSVGPKTAKLLYEKLKIKSVADLEEAIKNKRLEGVFGIKDKTIQNILKGIELLKKGKERMNLAEAMELADEFISALKKMPEVKKVISAGSLRRRKETVRDIDILVISSNPRKVMDAFAGLSLVRDILAKGQTKASVRTHGDIQVDCRLLPEKSFGAALLYFTGSKNFNIKVRAMAQRMGFKVNEYGVFAQQGNKEKFLASKTEEDIFKLLKMAYIEPELREDTGEIELAQKFKLPELIELKDIKGDLHAHSKWSDGGNTISGMSEAARKRGYSYIAMTDHSQSLKVAGGLTLEDLKKKKKEIERINAGIKGFRVLYATEVDIASDGSIDYEDGLLKEFDIVVAAIHSGFKQSKNQITRRLVRACANKYVHIIAHPTGKLWGVREAYEMDFNEVSRAAQETNTAFEINAYPQRLDLDGQHSRLAKEKGVKVSINTDAHTTDQLRNMELGVAVGRRGWLGRKDVINTLSLEDLLKAIKKY